MQLEGAAETLTRLGFNALHAAATAGQLEAVQMLLDATWPSLG